MTIIRSGFNNPNKPPEKPLNEMTVKEEIIEITFFNKRRGGERLPQITRAEAVERRAKALHDYERINSDIYSDWENLNEYIKQDYRHSAEAALNALLRGAK
nr:MAG TPA_asm: hypothetical protein [Caudoviricetes sp.]